jgi:hypothetical protein
MKYPNIREEELKNKVAQDYFGLYDCTPIMGNVDFCVAVPYVGLHERESLLWAEAKKGSADMYKSVVQLILTIGKARTFDKFLPPAFLGSFDAEKIAFLPYNAIQDAFYLNDFNWNVAPSNHDTKEFRLLHQKVVSIIDAHALLFDFTQDDSELRQFIAQNLLAGKSGVSKIKIDKNNFITIYTKWLQSVKPTIAVDWALVEKAGIIDGDFYLADLLSQENVTLKEKLFVLLNKSVYELDRKIDELGMFSSRKTTFTDGQKTHTDFWNKYERPPQEDYWDYIVERRDLLVPQDVRERKGSFFTPQVWVELSQKYLADTLGSDWQDEYYVWDCAAGTGNLTAGLTNKYHIYASTLDKQDVDVMHDRIENGANLLHEQVFQFDFLNDAFLPQSAGGKLPDSLYEILNDTSERKKLVIYINPPYAEATTARTVTNTGKNKAGVATSNKANQHFKPKIGNAANELFALFMAQVVDKCDGCKLAQFSTLKFIQGSNFRKFKTYFCATYLGGFVMPADTFDNVNGRFPIAFTMWDTAEKQIIEKVPCQIYERNGSKTGEKIFHGDLPESINKWLAEMQTNGNDVIGLLSNYPPDFQNQGKVFIRLLPSARSGAIKINPYNVIQICVYFAVRYCVKHTWLNNQDQFLYPQHGWQDDTEFQNDCLAYTLFHGKNMISAQQGINHWIPFRESEVGSRQRFTSSFMTKFMSGKLKTNGNGTLLETQKMRTTPLVFSSESQAVFAAGRELWAYYHQQPKAEVNASLYDIRAHFQGRNAAGRMNSASTDPTYTHLIGVLRDRLSILAQKIEFKVYEYGFLRH